MRPEEKRHNWHKCLFIRNLSNHGTISQSRSGCLGSGHCYYGRLFHLTLSLSCCKKGVFGPKLALFREILKNFQKSEFCKLSYDIAGREGQSGFIFLTCVPITDIFKFWRMLFGNFFSTVQFKINIKPSKRDDRFSFCWIFFVQGKSFTARRCEMVVFSCNFSAGNAIL